MTTFNVRFQIANPGQRAFEDVEGVVDTGSTFNAAPKELLERLGIHPMRRERFRIANGQVQENDVGEAFVRVEGREGTTPVIFDEPGEPVLLGAVTLEQLLLGVDPVAQRLIPVEGLRISRYPHH